MKNARSRALSLLSSLVALVSVPAVAQASVPAGAPSAVPGASSLDAASRGRSGALKAAVVLPGADLTGVLKLDDALKRELAARWTSPGRGAAEVVARELKAPATPGVWALDLGGTASPLTVITSAHFDGSTSHLNGYYIGRYPAQAARRTGTYAPPVQFIEVTKETQDTFVSEHFQLRQFLTKNQQDVWPKYLVLDLRLVDKLELVIQELRAAGHPAKRMHVMSGYRTPSYNAAGVGKGGRATFSRHTYGDAADVWVDDDGDGQLDDLNRDGKLDVKDAEVLASFVDRVESKYPELVGGHGVYRANRVHGPFVHVDVRGTPARWSKR
ncbi:MAG TPA: D-Ala-D-Ala carboxypeptidase family metallohydrolase [Myxococcus sp.]|nr:D-Ala-D-Ala carboxypeptidase family metallohydrolase [Myxococcus sp.]